MTESQNRGGRRPASPLQYAGLGFELVLPVVLLMFGGRWLDGRFGSEPWLLVAGAALGFVVGFYNLVRRVSPPGGPKGGKTD